jgi:hypothetical protein
MDFSNPADIKSHLASLEREDSDYQFWQRVVLNDFSLRISAGTEAFSEPHVNLDKITYYRSVGVLIYEFIKGQEHQVAPQSDVRFQTFDWVKYFQYEDGSGKTKESYMGSRIPLAETIQLIRDVYKISRLKMFY